MHAERTCDLTTGLRLMPDVMSSKSAMRTTARHPRCHFPLIWIGTVLILASAAGCRHGAEYDPADIPAPGTTARELIDTTPVVDVHTHTFNSRFLPIREIALGKRDMSPWFSLAGDSLVIALTELITDATETDLRGDVDLRVARRTNRRLKEIERTTGTQPANGITAEDIRSEPAISGAKKLLRDQKQMADLAPAEQRRLQKFAAQFAHRHGPLPGLFPDQAERSNEIRHFLSCLTAPSTRMESLFQNDHTSPDGKSRKVTLAVSHMMDMAPTYDQVEDGDVLFRFRKQQIPAMRRQQRVASGRMIYFVAYSPFRDHWHNDPEAGPGHALAIVKHAYEQQGAFGVKVYPPSGYRPTNNRIPPRPWSIASQPGRQWDARYKPHGVRVSGAELDARLDALYQWCVREDVPIFAHCGSGEVQARKGYHQLADPAEWRAVLERHPKLRLCLGHAGGGSRWTSVLPVNSWGRTVFQLCRDYPNVYCEFGCHEEIADPAGRAAFSRQIARLVRRSRTSGPYDFSTKILYGSDWFMPMTNPNASDRLNYLLSYQLAIIDAGGEEPGSLYRNVFHRNALRYLNVRSRLNKPGLPPATRKTLRRLLSLQ